MPKNKAFDLDGVMVEVLADHWNMIKIDPLSMILYFFMGQRILSALNHTFLVLIPKTPSPTTLPDYPSISCLGDTYKVILKILSNRLLTTLPNLIAKNQFAFLKGRLISNSINLRQEFTHALNNIGTSRRAFVMIDFSKVLESLRWDAINVVFEAFGYDKIFR